MVNVLVILAIVSFILLPIGGVVAFFLIRRIGLVQYSDTLVLNHNSHRTEGRFVGNLVSKEVGKNGRLHIRYVSKDSDKTEVHQIIAEPNKVLSYPKGTWSKDRAIIEILSEDAQSFLSKHLKNLEVANAETHIIKGLQEGLKRGQMHLEELGEGELSARNLSQRDNFDALLMKLHGKDTDKAKPSGYHPPRDNYTPS
jgi:hypothetical protein